MAGWINKNKLLLLGVFLFGVGFGLAIMKTGIFRKEMEATFFSPRYLPPNGSFFCKPLLRVETPQSKDPRLQSAKYSINRYINMCIEKKEASDISVYLMNLTDETWIGIREDDSYSLASLIKLPVMMIYLKLAEKDPATLNKTIKYETKCETVPQNIFVGETIQLGKTYTVDELLYYMITSSDNVAMALLMGNMDEKLIVQLYENLQLLALVASGKERKISAKDIAVLFQALYYATYLNKGSSDKALKLLSQSKFYDGLVAGVPKDVTVAHKFAERAYLPGNEKQLHDCGIVYYEKRSYLICVMTKGWDFNTLKGIIKHISKLAYDHMEQTLVVY